MDESDKKIFQMKFIVLTMMLNMVIILVGAWIVIFVIFHTIVWQVLAVVMFIAAVVFVFLFRKKYYATKVWLDEHA